MGKRLRFETSKTFDQLRQELEESIPALRPKPAEGVTALPGLDPPMEAVYVLSGIEKDIVDIQLPDGLSEEDLQMIQTIIES